MKMPNMTAAERAIPLPARPGTVWTPNQQTALACLSCGQPYNAHGAPEDVAMELGVELPRRHLICPASAEAWEEYRAARGRVSLEAFIEQLRSALAKLSTADRDEVLRRIV